MARPRGKRRGRYRMTPRRRAALRKAQQISAKKRKRSQTIRAVRKTAASMGGMFVAYHSTRYLMNPRRIGKDYRDLKGFSQKVNNKFFGGSNGS